MANDDGQGHGEQRDTENGTGTDSFSWTLIHGVFGRAAESHYPFLVPLMTTSSA